MYTTCETKDDQVILTIAGLEGVYNEAARALYGGEADEGFMHRDGSFSRTYSIDTPHIETICRNFERYVPEMIRQAAGRSPIPWEQALETFLLLIDRQNLNWWLVGSTSLAVRGIEVIPHDIDLSIDDVGARKLGEILRDYLVEPVLPVQNWFCNWWGRAFLHTRIEWVGGVDERADTPEIADFGPTAALHRETITWRGYRLHVPPLDLQLRVSEQRGLTRRTEAIRRALKK